MQATTILDLTIPSHAYFFGFVQGDGHLQRPKGSPNSRSLRIELNIRDIDILERFSDMFPSTIAHRHRSTNFIVDYHSVTWTAKGSEIGDELERLGMPVGRKSDIIEPPKGSYTEPDYWRGLIDADGALGFTKKGHPYVSLVASSDSIRDGWLALITKLTGCHRTCSRNVRDGVYNLGVLRDDAVALVSYLYYDGCLALRRKATNALAIKQWERPPTMRRAYRLKSWTPEQDEIVLTRRHKDAMTILGRSATSVQHRKERLRKSGRVPLYLRCHASRPGPSLVPVASRTLDVRDHHGREEAL